MRFGNQPLASSDDPIDANGSWWNENAREYISDHGEILGNADFIWGPEGVREADIAFLGDTRGKKILEIGAGAAQCARYLAGLGRDVTATDLSPGMLEIGHNLNEAMGFDFPMIVADARKLPFADDSFDVVFTSFGVIPFVPSLDDVNREVARVLRRGGIWAYSAMHPMRWMFPDDPTRRGMKITRSYFAQEPYVERDESEALEYAEFHHTMTNHVNSLASSGFVIESMFEPPWPAGRDIVWGGWGPERSQYLPGTLMIQSHKN